MSNNWLDLYSTSNRFIRTYVQGFVDISGGNLIVRNNDVSFNNRLVVGSDITTNRRLFTVGDTSHNGNLFVSYDTSLNSRLVVGSDVTMNNRLFVKNDVSMNIRLVVGSDITTNKRLFTVGDASLNGNLFVAFDSSLNSRLVVGSDTTIRKRLFTVGDASFSGNLYVGSTTASSSYSTGALIVNGGAGMNGNIYFSNNGTGLVWGSNFSRIMDDADLKIMTDDNMRFYTVNSERMTINSSGLVGIGTSSPGYTLHVNGTVGATTYNATSDYRIKANIISLSDTSFSVDYLNPVTYYNTNSNKMDVGFIAHEVQQQFPFLVTGEKDGSEYQTLNYNGLIGILTKEIQDLKKEVKEIRRELASYKH
jgi:hypothetical protein